MTQSLSVGSLAAPRITSPVSQEGDSPKRRSWLTTLQGGPIKALMSLSRTKKAGRADLREILDLFQEHTPAKLKKIEEDLERGDLERALRTVTLIQESAMTLGAEKMVFLCNSIQEAADDGEVEDVRMLVGFLELSYWRTVRAVRSKIEE